MQFSDNGLIRLKNLERFMASIYRDSAGKPTIGYGHVVRMGDGFSSTTVLTEEEASQLLLKDVGPTDWNVNKLVTSNVNQNQYDAMVLFTYNVGVTAFADSTLLRLVNAGDFYQAAEEFMKWDKIHTPQGMFVEIAGLKNRRQAEKDLFLTPVDNA